MISLKSFLPCSPLINSVCCRNVFAKVPVNSIPHINPGLEINDYISLLDQTRQRICRQSRKAYRKKNRQNRQTEHLPKINGCDFSLECSFTRLSSPVIKSDLLFEVRDSRLGRDICVVFLYRKLYSINTSLPRNKSELKLSEKCSAGEEGLPSMDWSLIQGE